MVSSTPRPHFTPGKDAVAILQEAGWVPGPVWTGGKSRPTGIQSRAVQPVVSLYTDWATRPTIIIIIITIIIIVWKDEVKERKGANILGTAHTLRTILMYKYETLSMANNITCATQFVTTEQLQHDIP